ncbi:G2/mitotic-specific cyclin-2 [Dionaea muscipula]
MASRPNIVPHQAKGEAAAGGVKQKKVGAEGRSKRAPLNDIGNVVTLHDIGNVVTLRVPEGKPQPQITRPITRRFCAQLLANAQANPASENNKKGDAVLANPLLLNEAPKDRKAVRVRKPVQKKVPTKSKPEEEVIEISPDTAVEEHKEETRVNERASRSRSCRKKVPTMTSLLTSRSKAACGLVDHKPKKEPMVDNIDAGDANNELAVVEYVEDIYKFYKLMEDEWRVHDYMESQPDINEKMRAILVDWLIEVHNKFELMPETLYLTIHLVDRFLAIKTVPRKQLQLVGMGAMLIACKYEEIWAPEVNDFVSISDRVYSNEQILMMEKIILAHLEWQLTVPTCYVFLIRFIKASMIPDYEMENLVYFLAELALMRYATIIYSPSMIAASAVYVARHTLSKTPLWTETLKLHTGYSESQLMDCAKMLVSLHSTAAENKLQVVYRKYSKTERGAVAQISAAKSLLAAAAIADPSSSSSSSSQ